MLRQPAECRGRLFLLFPQRRAEQPLIFSEHFFGIWGLIIGIPIFVFLLDILDVVNNEEKEKNGPVPDKT